MCVDNSITKEDIVYIKKFLDIGQVQPLRKNPSYEEQLVFIKAVQCAILHRVRHGNGLPYYMPREPKNIYKAIANNQTGACFDRSRLIEKILRWHGFKTRHVFMYSKNSFGGKLLSWFWSCLCFFCKHVKTHAVSEVLTKKGWLVIDSNANWVSIDKQNNPHSMKDIEGKREILWKELMCADMKDICEGFFKFLYGVYSRSGKLYPPFNFRLPFPDINVCEVLYNFPCLFRKELNIVSDE
jgi:Transglutaminase-like superfamily